MQKTLSKTLDLIFLSIGASVPSPTRCVAVLSGAVYSLATDNGTPSGTRIGTG